MTRTTIDFGIDLGTTNSSVAVLEGMELEVFKNNEGMEFTPSAVWIDRKDTLHVGRRAKERVEDDSENAHSEFKLQMGTKTDLSFSRSGRRMKPEELSAEVLKEMKSCVMKRTGEELSAAVITVPAAFEAPQCDATRKAAQLAGFTASPLLLEPVAAAQAYGFDSASDKVFWLVYDFGGGTFDCALIQLRDGIIQVVNHGGDNHLGGKLIDWAIVEQLLIPAVVQEFGMPEFRRDNPRWRAAIAKLKWHAEQAKIRASNDLSSEIIIDFLCQDEKGDAVRFEYDLKREDVERLATPFFLRAANIAKKVLTEKKISPTNVEKVILVGGPTQTPVLRDILKDSKEGLGIDLEFRVDPLTVVARGAAVFARTQRMPASTEPGRPTADCFKLQLEYAPAGPDPEPPVSGLVRGADQQSLAGFTVELVNDKSQPAWRSGKIPLSAQGTFMAMAFAEKGKLNTFQIELCDAAGTKQKCDPDQFGYTCINVGNNQILIHSISVALANNQAKTFLEKGQDLPARRRVSLKTAFPARPGQETPILRIPVLEGERSRADRNKYIGALEVPAQQLKRDLPAGVDVEVSIEVDESRVIRTKAYIPMLDEEFETSFDPEKQQPAPEELQREVLKEKQRMNDLERKTQTAKDPKADEVFTRIEKETMLQEIDGSLAAATSDRDAADKCQNRLLDLKTALDEAEAFLEWPSTVAEAEKTLVSLRLLVEGSGSPEQKESMKVMEQNVRKAIAARDPDLLRVGMEQLKALAGSIVAESPQLLVMMFEAITAMRNQMTDPAQADNWIAQGRRAISANDTPALQSAIGQLQRLLPPAKRQEFDARFAGTTT